MVRTAIVVSGMHRSGTSALTRVLSALGATLPSNLIPGRVEKKDADYWESRLVVDLNQRILREAKSWWGGWHSIDTAGLSQREALLADAREVVRSQFGGSDLIVLKDPRVCRLLPLWTEALEFEKYRCVHVLALRHPARVADSIQRRDGLGRKVTALSWLAHLLDAEAFTRAQPRLVVSLDNLVGDWRRELSRVEAALDLRWPHDQEEVAAEIDGFIDPALAHRTEKAVHLVEPVHRILARWAMDEVEARDQADLDEWRRLLEPIRRHPSPTVVVSLGAQREQSRETKLSEVRSWGRVEHPGYHVEARAAWLWLVREREHRRTQELLERRLAARPGPTLRAAAGHLRAGLRAIPGRMHAGVQRRLGGQR